MTLANLEKERIWEMANTQAKILTEMEHMSRSLTKVHSRVDEVGERIDDMAQQDERQEERLAELQELTSSLNFSVTEAQNTARRLKHIAFGFLVLLAVTAFMVGLLSEEILPKVLKSLWALVGM